MAFWGRVRNLNWTRRLLVGAVVAMIAGCTPVLVESCLDGALHRARHDNGLARRAAQVEVADDLLAILDDGTEIVQAPAPAKARSFEIVVLKAVRDGKLTDGQLRWNVLGCGHEQPAGRTGPFTRLRSRSLDQCWLEVLHPELGTIDIGGLLLEY